MATGDIHALAFSGTYAGVPVAITMAYIQKAPDPPVVSPGLDLIEAWFANVGGPWANIKGFLDEDMRFDCASSAFGENVDTMFLTDANGEAIGDSLPSTHCIQMNVPAVIPHPDGHEGRFYVPGIMLANVTRSGYSSNFNAQLKVFAAALLLLDSPNGGGVEAYQLIPHAGFRNTVGTTQGIDAFLPYNSEFVKVLGSRRADQCSAFTGGGAGAFQTLTIDPGP